MPRSKRRPAAVAKKKAAARPPVARPVAPAEEEIGTERCGVFTGVKRYVDERPVEIELD